MQQKSNLKEKRFRRNAGQIIRDYVCKTCSKTYGSEGSLNQHIKLKHAALEVRSSTEVKKNCNDKV